MCVDVAVEGRGVTVEHILGQLLAPTTEPADRNNLLSRSIQLSLIAMSLESRLDGQSQTEGDMECSAQEPASKAACSIESHREIVATLHSLRSLIYDLLRENQNLCTVLLTERSNEDGKAPLIENCRHFTVCFRVLRTGQATFPRTPLLEKCFRDYASIEILRGSEMQPCGQNKRGVCLLFAECDESTESDHSNARGYSLVTAETSA